MRSVVFGLAAFAAIETQAHTFQTCEVPRFEWAAYGNRVTGRMYGMTAAVNDNTASKTSSCVRVSDSPSTADSRHTRHCARGWGGLSARRCVSSFMPYRF